MRSRLAMLTLLAGLAAAGVLKGLRADEPCCALCGQAVPCRKVCRLVCEEKKVDISCWGCKCEEFCVPCPSARGNQNCEPVCDPCDKAAGTDVSSCPKRFLWYEWCPGAAQVYSRKKLMRRTVTKKVPSYKWVIEDLCADCEVAAPKVDVPAGTKLPAPPKAAPEK